MFLNPSAHSGVWVQCTPVTQSIFARREAWDRSRPCRLCHASGPCFSGVAPGADSRTGGASAVVAGVKQAAGVREQRGLALPRAHLQGGQLVRVHEAVQAQHGKLAKQVLGRQDERGQAGVMSSCLAVVSGS